MSARPCPIIVGDCIGVDSPVTGLSSEAEDVVYYYASCSPVADAFAPPALGGGIVTQHCQYTVLAATSQAEANALAAEACAPQSHTPTQPPLFYSNEQTAQVPCMSPDYLTDDQGVIITDDQGERIVLGYSDTGDTATVTVAAGTFTSLISQADADAQALAFATELANAKAEAHDCDHNPQANVLLGAGGDQVFDAGGNQVEPVSW